MMSDVAFGQFYPVDSFVHRLDPRFKILFLIAFIVAIFVSSNLYGLALCAAVLLIAVLFSRVPLGRMLRAVRGVLFLVLLTAVLNLFFSRGDKIYWGEDPILWQWRFLTVTQEGVVFSVFFAVRIVLLVTCSSLLTYTTDPVALTDGIESLFHVHVIALVMSIALRFIPVLLDETERIMNAQKARGANLDTGGLGKRVKAVVPVIIPLLISAFRRADELGDAMDARCYVGGKKRTKYKKLRFTWRDLLALLLLAGMIAGVVLLRIYLGAPL